MTCLLWVPCSTLGSCLLHIQHTRCFVDAKRLPVELRRVSVSLCCVFTACFQCNIKAVAHICPGCLCVFLCIFQITSKKCWGACFTLVLLLACCHIYDLDKIFLFMCYTEMLTVLLAGYLPYFGIEMLLRTATVPTPVGTVTAVIHHNCALCNCALKLLFLAVVLVLV